MTGSAWATSRFTLPPNRINGQACACTRSVGHTHLAGALRGFAAQAFVDGSLGSHTAYMFEPFADTPDQGTNHDLGSPHYHRTALEKPA
jgi:predicted amidohydrolase YtcJ